jgi:hypothetical protein
MEESILEMAGQIDTTEQKPQKIFAAQVGSHGFDNRIRLTCRTSA